MASFDRAMSPVQSHLGARDAWTRRWATLVNAQTGYRMVVTAILLVHIGLLARSAYVHFPCVDEIGHMPAGIWHVAFERFELFNVNPPLVRTIAAAPVVLCGAPLPEVPYLREPDPWLRYEFMIGGAWMQRLGEESLRYFRLARWAVLPFSVLGAWVCWRWAGDLYGPVSGLAALCLWCFCPTVLGHASCITPDAAAAALGAASCYAFWRWLRDPAWSSCLVSGAVLGLAQGTKMTWLLLFPLLPALAFALRRLGPPTASWRRRGGQLVVMLVLALAVLNSLYLWSDSFRPLAEYRFTSKTLGGEAVEYLRKTGNRFAGSWLGRLPVPLPKHYVLGIDRVKLEFERGQPSFLHGQWKHGGWWYYYLYAMAIKIPLGTWLLLAIALLGSVWPRRHWALEEWLVGVPAVALIALVSSQTGFTHHLRYVLPAFPFLFVLASKSFALAKETRWGTGVCACLLGWSIASSLSVFPHGTSYFNELVGGSANGYRHLHFSNVDWGQDLTLIKPWLEAHPEARPVYIQPFNIVGPEVLHVAYEKPDLWPPRPGEALEEREHRPPRPGWYIVSPNHVVGFFDLYNSHWGRTPAEFAADPSLRYLSELTPVDRLGFSMLVYHVEREAAADGSAFGSRRDDGS